MSGRHPDGTPQIPTQMCIECGYVMDAATHSLRSKVAPKPGDLALCLNCGHAMIFDDNMRHREITPEEWGVIATDSRLVAVLARARTHSAFANGRDLSKR